MLVSFDGKDFVQAIPQKHKETIKGYVNGLDDEYSEYMTAEEYTEFEARVNCYYANNYQKKKILLTKKINEDEWKSRALNDTRYISRFMADLLRNHMLFEESALKKKKVFVYNGVMTDYARKRWGITKVREDGDFHHAVDATVIACMTDGMRNKIERHHATHELSWINKQERVDMATGEIVTIENTSILSILILLIINHFLNSFFKCYSCANTTLRKE